MITLKRDKVTGLWTIRNGKSTWGPYSLPADIDRFNLQLQLVLAYRSVQVKK